MAMRKIVGIFIVIALLFMMLSACSRSRHELVGDWEWYDTIIGGAPGSGTGRYHTFNADGTGRTWFVESYEGWYNTFDWSASDGELTIEFGAVPEWMREELTPTPMPEWGRMVAEDSDFVIPDTPHRHVAELIMIMSSEQTVTVPYEMDEGRLILKYHNIDFDVPVHEVFARVD